MFFAALSVFVVSINSSRAQPYNWSGVYLGIHGGWGSAMTQDARPTGPFGGGQIGYNYQISSIVVGAELDGALAGITASNSIAGVTTTETANAFASGRFRFGYSERNLLLYATGGAGLAHARLEGSGLGLVISDEKWLAAWTGGGGLEWGFTPKWSAKVEYIYYWIQGGTFFGGAVPFGNIGCDTFKFGLNYHL
jgi:outer membrane immunogenic protein